MKMLLGIIIAASICGLAGCASKANRPLEHFQNELIGKTKADVMKAIGKPDVVSDCPDYKPLNLTAWYWRRNPPDEKFQFNWNQIVFDQNGIVCSDGPATVGENCRELDGVCGLEIDTAD